MNTSPASALAILTDELQAEHDRFMAELEEEQRLETMRVRLVAAVRLLRGAKIELLACRASGDTNKAEIWEDVVRAARVELSSASVAFS